MERPSNPHAFVGKFVALADPSIFVTPPHGTIIGVKDDGFEIRLASYGCFLPSDNRFNYVPCCLPEAVVKMSFDEVYEFKDKSYCVNRVFVLSGREVYVNIEKTNYGELSLQISTIQASISGRGYYSLEEKKFLGTITYENLEYDFEACQLERIGEMRMFVGQLKSYLDSEAFYEIVREIEEQHEN
mgnify:CR=1 FL=1